MVAPIERLRVRPRLDPFAENAAELIASVGGVVHAIDVATGTSKWKLQVPGQVHSTPSLFGDAILFGCDDGKVYAVDRHAGKKLWEAPSRAEVWSSPVVRNGVVFFGSADGKLYAIDADTGNK